MDLLGIYYDYSPRLDHVLPGGARVGQLDHPGAGVPRSQENALPWDPTVGLCLGSSGGPRGVGVLLWARYHCSPERNPEEPPCVQERESLLNL